MQNKLTSPFTELTTAMQKICQHQPSHACNNVEEI